MASVNILDGKLCTGCGLCNNLCPVGAIDMKPDSEGFIRPQINDKCVDCGLCAKKCPQLSKSFSLNEDKVRSFAVWCKDSFRPKGSSGGIFPAIAEHTVKAGGIVFGAAFEEGCRKLSLVGVDTLEELPRLYKSKYVQCDAGNSYAEAEHQLATGRQVVFSGCPCQIDALKTYLGRDYPNLLTIDILCHGTPSPFAYNKFLDEVSGGQKVTGVDFRDKSYGWGTLIRVDLENAPSHFDHYNGNYFKAFLSGMSMREGCYHCAYATTKRPGDITIGDFWGIDGFKEDWNDKKGTSMLLCNNKKGVEWLDKLSPYIKRVEELPYSTTVDISKRANGALVRPTAPHKMLKCFFEHLKRGYSFSESIRYAEKARMDIGILGWWIETSRSNYGSNLTDYALYQYLTSIGLSVAMVSPPNFDRANAGGFNKRCGYRMTAKYSYDDMKENNKYFDGFVVASDVLWYYDAFIQQGYNFLLDFADENKRKISYSTSFGNTVKFFPEDEMPYAKYLMKRFDHVSVREFEGVDICKNRFDVEATQVLDPVFLCDMEDWQALANRAERKTEGDFVFAYVLDPTPEKAHNLEKIAKKLKCKLVTITDRQTDPEKRTAVLKHYGVIPGASIEEFVYHLMNAKFVVADSFHGFCFSLIFDRPFLAVANRTRGGSRFDTLSKLLDIEDRLVESFNALSNFDAKALLEIDHERIQANIARERERSKKWLNNALFSPRERKEMDKDLVIGKDLYLSKKHISKLETRLASLEARLAKLEKGQKTT